MRETYLDRSHLLAALFGFFVGSIVYRFFLPDWLFAVGIAAVYTGIAYFYTTYEISLFSEHITFADKRDKLSHAIGVFGSSITPLALIEYAALPTPEIIGLLVWTTGIIMYLFIISTAQNQRRQ